MPTNSERFIQCGNQTARKDTGVGSPMEIGLHDRELVASKTRDRIVVANRGTQSSGNLLQKLISRLMTKLVVDRLEPVKIEAQHGYRSVTLRLGYCLLQTVVEQCAVGKIGQVIVVRHMRNEFLVAALLRHIQVGCHKSPAIEGDASYFQHRAIWSGAVVAVRRSLSDQLKAPCHVFFRRAGAILAALGIEAEQILHVWIAIAEKFRRIIQHGLLLLVAEDHSHVVIKQGYAAGEVVDDGLQKPNSFPQKLLGCADPCRLV